MQRVTGCAAQIVLNTDANAGDLRDNLSYIYGLYVEYVMKNPLYTPGEPFRCSCLLLHSAGDIRRHAGSTISQVADALNLC